ncbi:hypothetical protein GA0074692_6781 [Micromonospora pallida]|uniref:Uncharacterized protein n=1 Tax=Micromonospora pallida TaxID=145854 RepID=A0A1C6TN16_9ACTN|nr:hypothetical protein [Micromonospora pallida]SCL43140.1 hypothetical protein GA0074692_6730 [Micromonospora pallida]SCL43238.1 hypothetical protein GA0074692_6781 [Micromonospora pallida]
MSTTSRRPRPVIIYAATMAGLTTLTGYAGLDQLIPAQAVAWLALATLVVGAVGGVLVQSQVTPVADPRDQYGRRLGAPSPGGHLSGDVSPGR